MKEIKFKIKNGAVTSSASGYPGSTCKDATKVFTDALGSIEEDEPTFEMEEEVEVEYLRQDGDGA